MIGGAIKRRLIDSFYFVMNICVEFGCAIRFFVFVVVLAWYRPSRRLCSNPDVIIAEVLCVQRM
jgi:hypothetical protein